MSVFNSFVKGGVEMLALVLFAVVGFVPVWWGWKLVAAWPLFLFVMFLEFRRFKRRLPFELDDDGLIRNMVKYLSFPMMRVSATGFVIGWLARWLLAFIW